MTPVEYRERYAGGGGDGESSSSGFSTILNVRYGKAVLRWTDWMTDKCFVPLFLHIDDHPYAYLVAVLLITIALATTAILTNSFELVVDTAVVGLPPDSFPRLQSAWIDENFIARRSSNILLHASGANILTKTAISKAFDVAKVIPSIPDFEQVCGPQTDLSALTSQSLCHFHSVTLFWQNHTQFENHMKNLTTTEEQQDYILNRISSPVYWNGQSVVRARIFGHAQIDEATNTLRSAESLGVILDAPPSDTLEVDFVDRILSDVSVEDTTGLELELFTHAYLDKELAEPINNDLPLVFIAVITMAVFTSLAMTRWKKNSRGQRFVTSNAALGFGATVTAALSMATGYSFCSLCGYPITSITQVLPFVLIGVGLDDSFVLVGAYYESPVTLPFRERLKVVARHACPSITMTTLTDCAAFALGSTSNIPAIRWFGFYGVVCVSIDFIYQVTFFVALFVLDHRRSNGGRYDCLCCFHAKDVRRSMRLSQGQTHSKRRRRGLLASVREIQQSDKYTKMYAGFLMKPVTKAVVIVVFLVMFAAGAYFASQARVDIDRTDLTPDGAITDAFTDAATKYFISDTGFHSTSVYYHDLDVSDAHVRQQMLEYRYDLLSLGSDDYPPTSSFVQDFDTFLQESANTAGNLSFSQQLDAFLAVNEFGLLYNGTIVRNDDGEIDRLVENIIIAVNLEDTKDEMRFMGDQRGITVEQPLNQHLSNDGVDRMFIFSDSYENWEHNRMVPRELTMSLALSLVAVALVCALFLPHPTGTLFSVVTIVFVDVEIVGIIVLVGYTINSITMVLLIMSIGLVADYCLHIVHAYLHVDSFTRDGRAALCLQEVGGSIFLGGFTTFLGILALAFSSGQIFFSFFVIFSAMVVLGLAHGMVLLPVVLSLIGPDIAISKEVHITHQTSSAPQRKIRKSKSVMNLQQPPAFRNAKDRFGQEQRDRAEVISEEKSEDGSNDREQMNLESGANDGTADMEQLDIDVINPKDSSAESTDSRPGLF